LDVFVGEGLAGGAALLDGLAGAADEPAGGVDGVDEEPAAFVSFFSPTAVGDFSPSDGGFNLFE
jgi:hypothetical protein